MATLIALSPVNHDGENYAEGDELEVKNKADVDALVASGAALVKGKTAKAAKAAAEPEAEQAPEQE